MIIDCLQIRRNSAIMVDDAPCVVLDVSIQTPSARGANTMVKAKVRNLLTGSTVSRTFRGGEKLEEADLDTGHAQFLYRGVDDDFHFMDTETYDQYALQAEDLGDAAGFLIDDAEVQLVRYEGSVLSVRLPHTVNLRVTQTDPVSRGDTVSAQTKPATLETGLVVQVPPHVKQDDLIKVDTRTGKYVERV